MLSLSTNGAVFATYESGERAKRELRKVRRDQVVVLVDAPVGTSSSRSRKFRAKGMIAGLPSWAKEEYRVVRIGEACVPRKCAIQLVVDLGLKEPRPATEPRKKGRTRPLWHEKAEDLARRRKAERVAMANTISKF